MSDNKSRGKMYFIYFHSVNVKRNWTHLAQKNSRQELDQYNINCISITIKAFQKHLVFFEHQNHIMLF